MDPVLPKPDWFGDREWYWPFNKFCLHPDDLFTTLHDRYNTRIIALQNPVAFHRDVCECAEYSTTLDEFHSRLEERRAQRTEEITEGWREVSTLLSALPDLMFCALCYDKKTHEVKMKPGTMNDTIGERGVAFDQFARSVSFDTLVMFFDGFVRDERKVQDEMRRETREALAEIRRERAAKRLAAASRAIEASAPDSTRGASPRATHNKPSSRDAATSKARATLTAPSDKPRPTSSSSRRGPYRAGASSPVQTTENSRVRKRRNDEDAHRSGRKRRRVMSEGTGHNDTEKPAAAEAAPTYKQAEKRKRTDDSQSEARRKRSRIIDNPNISFRQSPEWSTDLDQLSRDISPTEMNTASSIPSTAVPPDDDDSDMADEEWILRYHQMVNQSSPLSPRDHLFSTIGQSPSEKDSGNIDTSPGPQNYADTETVYAGQAPLQGDAGRLAAIDTTTEAAITKKSRQKARDSRRQRADKRQSREELKPSAPQQQSRQKKRQERNASPSIQRLLRSRRSSRRNPGQQLWCLGDNAMPCAVAGTGGI